MPDKLKNFNLRQILKTNKTRLCLQNDCDDILKLQYNLWDIASFSFNQKPIPISFKFLYFRNFLGKTFSLATFML